MLTVVRLRRMRALRQAAAIVQHQVLRALQAYRAAAAGASLHARRRRPSVQHAITHAHALQRARS